MTTDLGIIDDSIKFSDPIAGVKIDKIEEEKFWLGGASRENRFSELPEPIDKQPIFTDFKENLQMGELWSPLYPRRKEFKLSAAFHKVIEESKILLELKDGWDGKHSKGYLLKTWKKMVSFLFKLSEKYFNTYYNDIDIPFIDPGSNGDINIHWKTKTFELFLTVSENDLEGLSYYGDDYENSNVIEGIAEIGKIDDLIGFMGKLREK